MTELAAPPVTGWTQRVSEQIYGHVYANSDREVGGVLVGRHYGDDRVSVEGVIPAIEAIGNAHALTFTHEAWESIHAQLDRSYPDAQLVGWYHSHPGLGVFLSRDDLFIQQNFFREPWQIAHVVDPVAGEEAIFGWQDDQIVELARREGLRRGGQAAPAQPDMAPRRPVSPWRWVGLLPLLIGAVIGFGIAPSLGVGGSPDSQTRGSERASESADGGGKPGAKGPAQPAVDQDSERVRTPPTTPVAEAEVPVIDPIEASTEVPASAGAAKPDSESGAGTKPTTPPIP